MKALIALVLVLFAAPLAAQTVVPANAALKLEATHDGVATDGYRIYVDNVRVADVPRSALVNGLLTAAVPPQPAGEHTAQLSAYNVAGESPKSQAVPFTALSVPLAPSNVKLSWTLTLSGGDPTRAPDK